MFCNIPGMSQPKDALALAKVCPLLKQHCLESSCAWYMQGCRRCAMLVMGEAGEIATTTAIIIPK